MSKSTELPDTLYTKHGTMKDMEPLFTPDARGMYIATVCPAPPTEEALAQINLHAQGELKAMSAEYKRAQEHWATLPHTPARQLSNLYAYVPELDASNGAAAEWRDGYENYDGLVYIFCVERRLNLKTNRVQNRIPVMEFNSLTGSRPFDDHDEKDCVTYRAYFAYAEKAETLCEAVRDVTDSVIVTQNANMDLI